MLMFPLSPWPFGSPFLPSSTWQTPTYHSVISLMWPPLWSLSVSTSRHRLSTFCDPRDLQLSLQRFSLWYFHVCVCLSWLECKILGEETGSLLDLCSPSILVQAQHQYLFNYIGWYECSNGSMILEKPLLGIVGIWGKLMIWHLVNHYFFMLVIL